MIRVLLLLILTAASLLAQSGNTLILRFPGVPTGTCAPIMLAVNDSNGALYDCLAGAWNLVSAGGGGAPDSAQYLVLTLNATLTAERRFVAGTALTGVDGGANGDFTLSVTADGIGPTQIDETANYTWTGIHSYSGAILSGGSPLVFEGATPDAFETTVVVTDPTADRNFTIPNADSVAIQPLTCGGTDKVSAVSALGVITCTADAGGNHNILSATHSDSLAASVVRGDIIRGNSTPAWSRLAIGAANTYLGSDATDAAWTAPTGGGTVLGTGRTLTGGAGIAAFGDLSADRTIATASGETDFLASGALTCGAATQGRTQVHTTPLQYCDNAATPTLRYAAYADSSGNALTGDTATGFFGAGQIEAARGGTGDDTSGTTGVPRISAGNWTYDAGISHLASSTSADLAGVISDETGTGVLVFGTSPVITTSLSQDGDVADAGYLRLQNAALIAWEASPAGTDITLTVDSSEVMQASGTFNAVTLTEGGNAVPNSTDNLSFFAATTSAQLAGVISDETGSGALVFGTSPTLAGTPVIGDGSGNDKLEFAEEATNPTCAAGNYFIWANSGDTRLKKCQNGTISDLDTNTGGSPAWETLVNSADTATTYTSDNTAETVTFNFQSAFGASQQFLVRQQTGNPTAGTLLDVRAADADVTVFRAGDGTNGVTVSQAGALTAEGTGPITYTLTTETVSAETYTYVNGDRGKIKSFTGSAPAVTLPQAGSGGNFLSGWCTVATRNVGANGSTDATITPTTSTINGGKNLILASGTTVICSDGTNYHARANAGARYTPADVGTTPGTAAQVAKLYGAVGGDTTIATTGVGGSGGAAQVFGGNGGIASAAATSATGGGGGIARLDSGDGGDSTTVGTTRVGGGGGDVDVFSGRGGDATGGTDATGGAGGDAYLQPSRGGNASGASGTNTGGAGGDAIVNLGDGGTGATANGTDGMFKVFGGARQNGTIMEVVENHGAGTTVFQIPLGRETVTYGLRSTTRTATGTYNANTNDFFILCDTSGGSVTVNLPAQQGTLSDRTQVLWVKKTSASNTCTLDPAASQTIDGSTTYALSGNTDLVQIQADGSNWRIIGRFDTDVNALGDNTTNGLWARTGTGTGSARTITGTANRVTVTNGDGVSGNPTISLPTPIFSGTRSITLFDPVAGDSGRIQVKFTTAVTITRVSCDVKAATSVTIQLDERVETTPETPGTNVLTSSLVCDTNNEATTSFANAGIAAQAPVAVTISSVSGTPDTLRVHIEYTVD